MPDEQAAEEYVKELRDATPALTPAEAERTVREQAIESVTKFLGQSMPEQAAAQAVKWVRDKGYRPTMTRVIQYIAEHAVDQAELNAVIMEQMAIRMLEAETPEEMLDPFSTIKKEQLLDKPILVEDVSYLISTVGDGFPWFVALNYRTTADGPSRVAIVGGEKLVPQVAILDIRGAFPRMLRIHESDSVTSSGFRVLELQLPQGNAGVPADAAPF